ncbi:MAG: dNTP triphosphohydrolase [Fimbriimonadaceae bacterium]|nr:dNTP triphosphohydrolase [Fimbriimonadaceae bacterium]
MLARSARLHAEESSDSRSAFQRDRDRLIYCAQLRRLSGVTQVTSPVELHTFHNRLTHTLEVAQIARRTAERLLKRSRTAGLREHLDPDVCEAAALAHDLGHPPFGHNGEVVLDRVSRDADPKYHPGEEVKDGYEGNAQSFRILTRLSRRCEEYEGLNLTVATLRASVKYPWVRPPMVKELDKFGAYQTEASILNTLFDGLPSREQTLEAQIMDWADDVAFSVHDLYDFALAGVIPLDQIRAMEPADLRALLAQETKAQAASDDAFVNVCFFLNRLPPTDIRSASRFSSNLVAQLKTWVSTQITRFTDTEIELDLQGDFPRLVHLATVSDEVNILKALTKYFVIGSPSLAVRQEGEAAALRKLHEILMDDARLANPRLMSVEARERLQHEQVLGRIVLDTVSAMTDAQALGLYQKLTGYSVASVLDLTTPSLF